MKRSTRILITALASVLMFFLLISTCNDTPEKEQHPPAFTGLSGQKKGVPQVVEDMKLKKSYSFCGEVFPLDNFDVYERLEREMLVNTYWHSSTLMNIKASGRYFPVIEKILEEQGVPRDFKYVAVAESNLRNVKSPAGACGIWQFMEGNAEYYQMEVRREVDERYHIEKSTLAACKLIKSLKKRFGTWTMAAAAYNFGETNLAKEIEAQRAKTYFDLNLNEETSRYLFRIVALKSLIEDPETFGYYLEKIDYYKPLDDYKIIEVKKSIENLGDFAIQHGTTYRILKVYNPWLRTATLPNASGKTYKIKVPK